MNHTSAALIILADYFQFREIIGCPPALSMKEKLDTDFAGIHDPHRALIWILDIEKALKFALEDFCVCWRGYTRFDSISGPLEAVRLYAVGSKWGEIMDVFGVGKYDTAKHIVEDAIMPCIVSRFCEFEIFGKPRLRVKTERVVVIDEKSGLPLVSTRIVE